MRWHHHYKWLDLRKTILNGLIKQSSSLINDTMRFHIHPAMTSIHISFRVSMTIIHSCIFFVFLKLSHQKHPLSYAQDRPESKKWRPFPSPPEILISTWYTHPHIHLKAHSSSYTLTIKATLYTKRERKYKWKYGDNDTL